MNRRKALRSIGVVAVAAAPVAKAQEWKDSFAKQWRDMFLSHWAVEKKYTLAVVDAMPADGFESKPVPEQRTFADQLVHLGRANTAYMSAFGVKDPLHAANEAERLAASRTRDAADRARVRVDEGRDLRAAHAQVP